MSQFAPQSSVSLHFSGGGSQAKGFVRDLEVDFVRKYIPVEHIKQIAQMHGLRVTQVLARGGQSAVMVAVGCLKDGAFDDNAPKYEYAIKTLLKPNDPTACRLRDREIAAHSEMARSTDEFTSYMNPDVLPIRRVIELPYEGAIRKYLVFPLVRGPTVTLPEKNQIVIATFSDRIRALHGKGREVDSKATLKECLRHFSVLCKVIDDCHRTGIIHRDVKPGNMIVTHDHHAFMIDFGMCRLSENASEKSPVFAERLKILKDDPLDRVPLTRESVTLFCGTPAYIPPESIDGDFTKRGPEADIWALGMCLSELLLGTPLSRLPAKMAGLESCRMIEDRLANLSRIAQLVIPTDLENRELLLKAVEFFRPVLMVALQREVKKRMATSFREAYERGRAQFLESNAESEQGLSYSSQ